VQPIQRASPASARKAVTRPCTVRHPFIHNVGNCGDFWRFFKLKKKKNREVLVKYIFFKIFFLQNGKKLVTKINKSLEWG
jgi:hypothetical protein